MKEVINSLAKKTSVEIACPLTSIMEDDDEYDRKSPGKSVEKVFQTLTTQRSEVKERNTDLRLSSPIPKYMNL